MRPGILLNLTPMALPRKTGTETVPKSNDDDNAGAARCFRGIPCTLGNPYYLTPSLSATVALLTRNLDNEKPYIPKSREAPL